jgi:ZIP family zinc transporter
MWTAMTWGLMSGSGVLLGALVGHFARPGRRLIGTVMGFGAGVLVSALAFDLMEESYQRAGAATAIIGFVIGALAFVLGDLVIDQLGGEHRKRSHAMPDEINGSALWLGAALDGVPESIALGVSILNGLAGGLIMMLAIFISNFPEGMSGATGMTRAGMTRARILGMWFSIVLLTAAGSMVGFLAFDHVSPSVMGATLAVAAGAIMAMLADTMMPEAFSLTGNLVALATALGFICAFCTSKLL